MAITNPTEKLIGSNTANQTAYDTALVTLTAGRWYTLQTTSYGSTSHTVSTVVHDPLGTPLSFTRVTDGTTSAQKQNWDAAAHRIVEVWAVNPASTTASAKVTITFSGAQSAAAWTITEWSAGVDGTTFAQKVVINSGTAGTTASCTMSAFSDTNNATWMVIALGTGTADPAENIVAGESRTELDERDDAERSQHANHYQNPNGGDTSLTATWTNAEDWAVIGIEVKAAATNITVTPGVGQATWSGLAPSAVINNIVAPGVGQGTWTGLAPVAQLGLNVLPGVGQGTWTGLAPTAVVTNNITVTPGLGQATWTGLAPTVLLPNTVTPGIGAATWTGLAPTVLLPQTIIPGIGQGTWTGLAPTVLLPITVVASVGAATWAGFAPTISIAASGVTVSPGVGLGTWTGLVPTVVVASSGNPVAIAGTGNAIWTGFAPSIAVTTLTPTDREANDFLRRRLVMAWFQPPS